NTVRYDTFERFCLTPRAKEAGRVLGLY
ncbi:hypothetical protein KIPB_015243, partial [Kipferlia bialata]